MYRCVQRVAEESPTGWDSSMQTPVTAWQTALTFRNFSRRIQAFYATGIARFEPWASIQWCAVSEHTYHHHRKTHASLFICKILEEDPFALVENIIMLNVYILLRKGIACSMSACIMQQYNPSTRKFLEPEVCGLQYKLHTHRLSLGGLGVWLIFGKYIRSNDIQVEDPDCFVVDNTRMFMLNRHRVEAFDC